MLKLPNREHISPSGSPVLFPFATPLCALHSSPCIFPSSALCSSSPPVTLLSTSLLEHYSFLFILYLKSTSSLHLPVLIPPLLPLTPACLSVPICCSFIEPSIHPPHLLLPHLTLSTLRLFVLSFLCIPQSLIYSLPTSIPFLLHPHLSFTA